MTPDEQELRSALSARSATPSADFRNQLSVRLANGRPQASLGPAAAFAAALLVVAAVGALLATRHLLAPSPVGQHRPLVTATVSPSPEPSPETSPAPSPEPSPVVTPGSPTYPTNVDVSAAGGALWDYVQSWLYRSTDGGSTWQQRTAPPHGGSTSFIDAQHGWALGAASPATQCQAEIVTSLDRTTDGASSWQSIPATGIGSAQCKHDLSFIDGSHGFLTASDPNSPPVIYRTSDGGQTWSAAPPLADPPGFQHGTGGFQLSAGTVRAFGTTLLVNASGMSTAGTQHAYVFRSLNGGATWSYLATLPDPAVGFASATRWLLLYVPAEETTDSGATWHPFSTTYGQAAPIAPEVIFDASTAYAITSRGEIQRSLDGGIHWTTVKVPGT